MPSPTPLTRALLGLFVLAFAAGAPRAHADEEKSDSARAEAPKTVVVRARPFAVTLELKSTFAPQKAVEVAYEPEVYGGVLEVKEAADPGAVVAGQTLVHFDDEQIREDLRDRERDLFIVRARLTRQEAEFLKKKESAAIHLQGLQRGLQRAVEGLERFRVLSRPTRIAQSEHGLQGSENRIQDEVEELEQLEKMYEADDLTEETEAIVLRRAKRSLARMRRSFEWSKQRHEILVSVTLPREAEDLELGVRRKKLDYETYRAALEADLRRAELELEKARASYRKGEKKLRELQGDRDALRVRAPKDGFAVPGAFKGTAWGDIAGMRRALLPGGRLKARQVLYTIVRPGDVTLRATVGEADVSKLKVGQEVEVRPGVAPDQTLAAVLQEVLPVGTGGKHAVRIDLKDTDKSLMPGQSAKATVRLRVTERALVLPAGAVQKKGDKHRVWVWTDGKATPRDVKPGATSGGRTEILEGVEEGEHVLERPPEEAK